MLFHKLSVVLIREENAKNCVILVASVLPLPCSFVDLAKIISDMLLQRYTSLRCLQICDISLRNLYDKISLVGTLSENCRIVY